MKTTIAFLCCIVAAASALPFQLNTIAGPPQKSRNSAQGNQQNEESNFLNKDVQQKQPDFNVPFGESNPQHRNTGVPSGNNEEASVFGSSPFGALLSDAPLSPVDDFQPELNEQQFKSGQTFDNQEKQFSGNQQPSFNSASGPAPAGNQQPSFHSAAPGIGSAGPFNVGFGGDGDFYLRTAFPASGFQPIPHTSVDMSSINSANIRNSGHQEYITVPEDDFSGEDEIYQLVGVAPSSAVQGGAAMTYSSKMGANVPIYVELDDVNEHNYMMHYMKSNPQPTVYSGQANAQPQQPWTIRADGALSDNKFVVLLDH